MGNLNLALRSVVAHLIGILGTMHFQVNLFQCEICIMGLSNIILKLGFRRTFDGTVNVNRENNMCIELTIYLVSFFVEIKKKCVHQDLVKVVMYISVFL